MPALYESECVWEASSAGGDGLRLALERVVPAHRVRAVQAAVVVVVVEPAVLPLLFAGLPRGDGPCAPPQRDGSEARHRLASTTGLNETQAAVAGPPRRARSMQEGVVDEEVAAPASLRTAHAARNGARVPIFHPSLALKRGAASRREAARRILRPPQGSAARP